ncbi:hypothetical protein BCVP_CDS0221 [Bacillus phage BC-VP]|nr:hypothetical protein BCVP_CDS0221 [Bacillus phage BC-VP]
MAWPQDRPNIQTIHTLQHCSIRVFKYTDYSELFFGSVGLSSKFTLHIRLILF